ncbi:hypothetical protein [Nocardioides sp. BYT-33-1]|uniref:hypothetical protein n=1 Tax=Nocardioides sp. BYT-33-1 TaxID=3416952 RepID=UPI003F529C63
MTPIETGQPPLNHNTVLTRAAAALGTSLLALLSACGTHGIDSSTEATPAPTGAIRAQYGNASDIHLPLDDHLLSGFALREIWTARTELVGRCVERFSQRPFVPEAAVGVLPAFSPYRFGIVGVDAAEKHGYHDPDDELSPAFAAAHAIAVPKGDPTPAYILDGDVPRGVARPTDPSGAALPSAGCEGDAEWVLGGPAKAAEFVASEIVKIEDTERSDPRVAAAMSDWASCMTTAGFSYENPLDPVVEFGGVDSVSEHELEVAVADAACRQETQYVERRVEVLTEIQNRSLSSHRVQWDSYREWAAARSRKALGYLQTAGMSGTSRMQAEGLTGQNAP